MSQPLPLLDDLPPGTSLGIASVPNLRDAGGYGTLDGGMVRRGLVYRSNQLAPISAPDLEKIAALGLKTDFDLRTAAERAARPDVLPEGVENIWLDILAGAENAVPATLGALLRDPKAASGALGAGRIDELYESSYREFVTLESARTHYRALFVHLADPSRLPALYHCTTGKDRTGWASATLLSLLGVPRDLVMADYVKSNAYILPHYARRIDTFTAAGGARPVAEAIFGVKPRYLAAAFDEMEKRHGTIEAYFEEGLGIDAAGQARLRALFLAQG